MRKINILMTDNRFYVSTMLKYDGNYEKMNSTLTTLFCLITLLCNAGQGFKLANLSSS